jgi:hypothetical protein
LSRERLPPDVAKALYAQERGFYAAIREATEAGRSSDLLRLQRCLEQSVVWLYRCHCCSRIWEDLQGKCSWRGCPGCHERYFRALRLKTWRAMGPHEFFHSWVVTVPPELRDQITPAFFTYYANLLVKWIERELAPAMPCGFIFAHYTGEGDTSVYHPHFNIVIGSRGLSGGEVATVLPRRQTPANLKRWRVGLSGSLGIDANRSQANLTPKLGVPAMAHCISYVLRSVGDGDPVARVRWTLPRKRMMRPFGVIAQKRRERWEELNPHDQDVDEPKELLEGPESCKACDSDDVSSRMDSLKGDRAFLSPWRSEKGPGVDSGGSPN